MVSTGHSSPERQIIVVIIGVIQKSSFLNHQPPRVLTGPAGVPTQRSLTRQPLDDLDRLVQMLALNLLGYVTVIDPTVPV